MLNGREADLWRQVAAVVGRELVKWLGTDVAASEWLGGNNMVQGREGFFNWCTNRGRVITHLQKKRSENKFFSLLGVSIFPPRYTDSKKIKHHLFWHYPPINQYFLNTFYWQSMDL